MSDIYHLFPANILGNQISVDSELSTLSVSGTAVIEDLISRNQIDDVSGGGTPSLPFNSVQFNDSGTFGGSANLTWDGTNLRIDTPNLQLGSNAGQTGQGANAVALGSNAGQTGQGANAVAIGLNAAQTNQPSNAVALGNASGPQTASSVILNSSGASLPDGGNAGFFVSPIRNLIAGNLLYFNPATQEISHNAAIPAAVPSPPVNSVQFNNGGAFGGDADLTWDGTDLILQSDTLRLGSGAGSTSQLAGAIALGINAGQTQIANAIAIGNLAGDVASQAASSIILNASGVSQGDGGVAGLFANPVREVATTSRLYYNPTSREITYSATASSSSFKQVSFPGVYPPNPAGPSNATNSCSFNGTTRVLLGTAPHAMSLQFTPGVDTGIWKIEARGSFLHNSPGGAAYLWFDNGTSPQDATGAAWSNLYENTLSIFYEATGGERGMAFTSYILEVPSAGPVQQVDWCFCSDGATTDLFFEGYVSGTGLLTMPNGLVPGSGATPIPNPPGGGPAVAGQAYRNYLNMIAVKIA